MPSDLDAFVLRHMDQRYICLVLSEYYNLDFHIDGIVWEYNNNDFITDMFTKEEAVAFIECYLLREM